MTTATDEQWEVLCDRHLDLENDWRNTNFNRPSRRFNYRSPPDLRCFKMSQEIMRAVVARNPSQLSTIKQLDLCASVNEYCDSLGDLLNYEELHRAINLRQFDQFNQRLNITFDSYSGRKYGIKVPLMGASPPFDSVILSNMSKTWSKVFRTNVEGDYATLQMPAGQLDSHLAANLNFSFIWSGKPHVACHDGIRALRERRVVQRILFEEDADCKQQEDKIGLTKTDTGELKLRLEKLDSCQRQAMIRILKARCRPNAYIVIGPPGSGKSHVLVEAVVQIYKRSQMNILVCVSSNGCADRLYDKLAQSLPRSDLLRIKAGGGQNRERLRERIVVSTNSKSFSLEARGVEFDYVFMDEANHSAVTEALVPLRYLKNNGCLVFCGDPKQLNPSTQWQEADKFGLGSSLLDKLLQFKIYQVGNDNSGDYITKLVRSHRCDERILATSNELFYNQEAKCLTQTPKSILNLMRLTGPVQFVPVTLDSIQEAAVPYSNEKEADCVVDLIIKLYKVGFEPEQIGVISPYKVQASVIASKLNLAIRGCAPSLDQRYPFDEQLKARDWCCKIDTVANFQGDERDVIIVSTVDNPAEPGKLEHPMRFNVAVSRAKWLMIVVGNPDALSTGKLWPKLLDRAIKGEIERWQASFVEENRSTRGAFDLSQSLKGLSIANSV